MNKENYLKKLFEAKPHFKTNFDYSQVPEEFQSTEKIPVTCHKHGLFLVKAYKHLHYKNCPGCWKDELKAGVVRLPQEVFVERARKKFGDVFDYSKVNYLGLNVPVVIGCPVHGFFKTNPKYHIDSKTGCNKCSRDSDNSVRKNEALEKAKTVHGDIYDYSRVDFLNQNRKVELVCKKHGSFWQTLAAHIEGHGCLTCSFLKQTKTKDLFVEESRKTHGDKYVYDKVEYINDNVKVLIGCKVHGYFEQRPSSHKSGCGCGKCHIEKTRLGKDEFIKKSRLVHGDTYDYSKVNYLGNKKKVEIVCKKHGSFWQKPNTHISTKNGCHLCSESKGEREISLILKKYKIEHTREYRIKPHLYRYDFLLDKLNILIEFNGKQHYSAVSVFGGEEEFEKTKRRDLEKALIAKVSGYELLILNSQNYRDGSLESHLISMLKKSYKYWFRLNGELVVFKGALDVYRAFNLDLNIKVTDLVKSALKSIIGLEIVF